MPHTYPHVPLAASPVFSGKSGQGLYGDVMQEIDWSVGQVLQALKDNGLDDNTLVMFSSDNGPWCQGSQGGLRGRKGDTYEGGFASLFRASSPGRIPAGQVSTVDGYDPGCSAYVGAPGGGRFARQAARRRRYLADC